MVLSFHNFAADIAPVEAGGIHIALLALIGASTLALVRLFLPKFGPEWLVRLLGGVGVGALAGYFVSRFLHDGVEPLGNIFEILILIALGLVVIAIAAQFRRPQPGLNAAVHPIAVIMMLMAMALGDAFGPGAVDATKRESLSSPTLIGHIVLAVIATVQLAFAAMVSGIYLLQDRALSEGRDSAFFRNLPSIETMRTYISVAVDIGCIALTISLVLGFVAVGDDLLAWMAEPIVITSILMWFVLIGVAVCRRTGLLYGKRIPYVVLLGFGLVLLFFVWAGLKREGPHALERREQAVRGDAGALTADAGAFTGGPGAGTGAGMVQEGAQA